MPNHGADTLALSAYWGSESSLYSLDISESRANKKTATNDSDKFLETGTCMPRNFQHCAPYSFGMLKRRLAVTWHAEPALAALARCDPSVKVRSLNFYDRQIGLDCG